MFKNKTLSVAIYLIIMALLVILYYTQGGEGWFSIEKIDVYQEYAQNHYVLVSLILFLLMTVFSIFGLPLLQFKILFGFFFGFWLGGITGWLLNFLAIAAHFIVTRYILYEFFSKKYGGKKYFKLIENSVKDNVFTKVAILRTAYVVPNNLINFYFSLFTKKPKEYLLGTLVGLLPTDLIDAFIGASLRDLPGLFANPKKLFILIGVFVLYLGFIILVQKKMIKKKEVVVDEVELNE